MIIWFQFNPSDQSDSDITTIRDYVQNLAKAKQKHLETVQRKREYSIFYSIDSHVI